MLLGLPSHQDHETNKTVLKNNLHSPGYSTTATPNTLRWKMDAGKWSVAIPENVEVALELGNWQTFNEFEGAD